MNNWNAHVYLRWSHDYKDSNWEWLKKYPQVKRAWSTMGDWDCCLEVDVATPQDLEEFVWKQLRTQPWVWSTHSTWSKEVYNNYR